MTPEQEALVTENIKLTYWAAHTYRITNTEYEDRVQMAAIGLCKAACSFDPDLGFKFTTYCVPFMRNELLNFYRVSKKSPLTQSLNALMEKGWDSEVFDGVHSNLREVLLGLSDRDAMFVRLRSQGLTLREIAQRVGVSHQRVQVVLSRIKKLIVDG